MAPGPAFAVLFWLQVAFYAAGLLSKTPLADGPQGRFMRLPWTFILLNAAAVV